MRRAFRMAFLLSLLGLISACGEPENRQPLRGKENLVEGPGPEPDTSKDKNVVVIIDTSKGKIKAELFAEKAPITVKNFLKYVDEKYYDGLVFHRVIENFMIQGGGMMPGSTKEKPSHAPIRNEAGNRLLNRRGTLAMARTDDPDSATSQFFINVKDNDFLNRARGNVGYAVFGKVLDGMDVVDAIRRVPTTGPPRDSPIQDVIIKSIRRAE